MNIDINMSLGQARNILSLLGSIKENPDSGLSFSPMTASISPSPDTLHTNEKIRNYVGENSHLWNVNLSDLPQLIRQIAVLMIDYVKKENNELFEEGEIGSAIRGLNVLLQTKADTNRKFIESALYDLTVIQARLVERNLEKAKKLQEVAKESGEAIKIQNEEEKPARPSFYSNLYSYLSYPSVSTMASYLPHWPRGGVNPSSLTKSISSPALSETVADLAPSPITWRELKALNRYFYYKCGETNESKIYVRSLLDDKAITSKVTVKSADEEVTLNICDQFYKDFGRSTSFAFNNEKPIYLNPSMVKKKIELGCLDKNFSLGENSQPAIDCVKIIQLMQEKIGHPLCFERLCCFLHQSTMADIVVQLTLNQPAEWKAEGCPLNLLNLVNVYGLEHRIYIKADHIHTISHNLLVVRDCNQTDELNNSAGKPIGYVAIERQMILPIKELEQSFEGLTAEQKIPHLQVKDAISDFCLTPLEAENNLALYYYQRLYNYSWNALGYY